MGHTAFITAIFWGRLVSSTAINKAQAKATMSEIQAKTSSKFNSSD